MPYILHLPGGKAYSIRIDQGKQNMGGRGGGRHN